MTIQIKYPAWLLGAFLTFILVRTMPFSPRGLIEVAADESAGDWVKQIATIAFALALGAAALRVRGADAMRFPFPFLMLMAFATVSLTWSAVPLIAGKRLGLTAIVGIALLMGAAQLRPKTLLAVFRTVSLGLAAACLLSAITYPHGAFHLSGDPEPSVIGAMRGVFYHKNLAGGVMGLAVLLCAEAFLRSLKPAWAAALIASAAALFLTHSTTSEISVVVAMILYLLVKWSNTLAARDATRGLILRAGALTALVPALIASWFLTPLHDYALDPEAFSGRGQLWGVINGLIADRPLLGFGYQSVFQVGDAGPLVQRNLIEWIRHVPHSHNGVLDLVVTIGVIGSALFVWAMFADPWRRVASLPAALRDAWQPVCAGLLAYAATHSLMEGKIFSADSVEWVILVVVLGLAVRLQDLAGQMPASGASRTIKALWPEQVGQP